MPDEDEDGAGGPHSGGTATAVGAEDLSLAIATAAAGAEDSRRAFLDGGSASIWRAFKETLKSLWSGHAPVPPVLLPEACATRGLTLRGTATAAATEPR